MASPEKATHIGGSAIAVGIGIVSMIPIVRPEIIPHLGPRKAVGLAVIGVMLTAYGILKPFLTKRSSAPIPSIKAPKRIGIDAEGSTVRLKGGSMKNQDTGVRAKDSEVDLDDHTIE